MIKYADIEQANSKLKTTDIKGKDYTDVSQRIKAFRMLFPTGKIETTLVSNANGVCIFKAEIYTDEGNLLATGTAYEKENSTFINKTSYIENCETSAVGRALGMCGIGIDNSVASYEEVANAIHNQSQSAPRQATPKQPTPREKLISKLKEKGIDINEYAKEKGLTNKTTAKQFNDLLAELEG